MRLRNAPKARGRWGEQQPEERARDGGLVRTCRFRDRGQSVDGEDGAAAARRRSSALPGGQTLVIDAKCSLNAYQDAFDEVDDDERARHASRPMSPSIRNHVNTLGTKAYWAQFDDAPDYVIMFIPGEHFLSAALEQDPTLWDYAFEQARAARDPDQSGRDRPDRRGVWRQERLAKEARADRRAWQGVVRRLAKADRRIMREVGKNFATVEQRLQPDRRQLRVARC